MTVAATPHPPAFHTSSSCDSYLFICGGTLVFGSLLTTSLLRFVFFLQLLTMPPKHKGKGKRSYSVAVSVSPMKQVRKAFQCNYVPMAITQALEESLTADEDPVSSQDLVSHKLETMMTMLI